MKIEFTKNTGKFQYKVVANPSDSATAALVEQGIIRVLQGSVLAGWEKSVAYPGKGVKRPEKFNRNTIEFTPENVEALKRALAGAEVQVGENEKEEPIFEDLGIDLEGIEISEYSGAAAYEPKFKAQKDLVRMYLFESDGKTVRKLKSGEDRTVESFCESRGITPPTDPWDEDTVFLAAVKQWEKEENERRMAQE